MATHGRFDTFKRGCTCEPCLQAGRNYAVANIRVGDISWESWEHMRGCKGLDPNIFFPGDDQAELQAKQICFTCDAEHHCREYAITTGQAGVWGATSDRDRDRIYRIRHRAERNKRKSHKSLDTELAVS